MNADQNQMNTVNAWRTPHRQSGATGFTLVEILIAITIIGALLAIALPMYSTFKEQQNIAIAVSDLKGIDIYVSSHKVSSAQFPNSLSEVPRADRKDPWGNPYEYLKIQGDETAVKGKMRRDKSTNPINTDFDPYSKGPDGETSTQRNLKTGQDDIVRASDGGFFGPAAKF
ncbi:MAG TPA: prepilin-type N-terminal cleavage/methylation domain-containing protein [Candidatus Binatia bacterium]|nr:prepilin-type N-terminal cleavage/methylation domain-containing protein [Candidatus Binatia bacterium]